jgi:hypothetical protein
MKTSHGIGDFESIQSNNGDGRFGHRWLLEQFVGFDDFLRISIELNSLLVAETVFFSW